MTYNDTIQNLSLRLTTYFDEVYHSAEIVTTDGKKFPAVINAREWIDLSPTDEEETIYIRRNGDDQADENKMASCSMGYKMRTPLRIVYFKDNAANHNKILAELMQSVLVTGTKLRSITVDKWRLQKEESSGDYQFGPTTAYFAIDINAIWDLQPSTCEEDFCVDVENPVKKCLVNL